jgi:hypothetical protein
MGLTGEGLDRAARLGLGPTSIFLFFYNFLFPFLFLLIFLEFKFEFNSNCELILISNVQIEYTNMEGLIICIYISLFCITFFFIFSKL